MSIAARTVYLASKAVDMSNAISAPIEQFNQIASMSTQGIQTITDRFDSIKSKMITQNGGSTDGIEDKVAKIEQKKTDALTKYNNEVDATKSEAEGNITEITEKAQEQIKGVNVSLSVSAGVMTPVITPELFSVDTDIVDKTIISPDTIVLVPGNPPGTITVT